MSYLARRLLSMIPVLFLLTILIFVALRLGGDPIAHMLPNDATPEEIQSLRVAYGFDRPIYVQYWEFARRAAVGDFGSSIRYRAPAMPLVIERVPMTAKLAGYAIAVSLLVALPLGIISAVRQNSLIDLFATTVSVLGRAMPDYWVGIMMMMVFAVWYRWVPVSGYGTFKHMILPSITLGTSLATTLTRLIRSSMLEIIRMEYVTTARSKGLSERVVLYKHALRNALIPVVTVFGLQVAGLLGGATIVEQVFALPGMGRLMISAVQQRDMAIVQAGVFVFALIVMTANLIVDMLYVAINPRVRYQ